MSGLALPPSVCEGCRHLGDLRTLGEGPGGTVGADYPCLLTGDAPPGWLKAPGAVCPHREVTKASAPR